MRIDGSLLLFDAGGDDLAAFDLNLDGEGRADSRAGNDGSTNESVGSAAISAEVINGMRAGIGNHGMDSGEVVRVAQFFRVGDEFQFACAVRSPEREGPICIARKPDDHCREAVAGCVAICKFLS